MNDSKINERIEKDFDSVSPEIRKACYDCNHLTSRVSWWCGNEQAIKWRGTSIPGVHLCKFWEAMPPKKSFIEKIVGLWNG